MKAPLVKQASVLLLASAFSLATALCASTQNTPVGQSVPSGPVSFSFTNSTVPVYDLTGSYQFDQEVLAAGGTTMNLSLGFSVQQDAAGRLRGSGVTNMQIGTNLVAAQYTCHWKGKRRRRQSDARYVVDPLAGAGHRCRSQRPPQRFRSNTTWRSVRGS